MPKVEALSFPLVCKSENCKHLKLPLLVCFQNVSAINGGKTQIAMTFLNRLRNANEGDEYPTGSRLDASQLSAPDTVRKSHSFDSVAIVIFAEGFLVFT